MTRGSSFSAGLGLGHQLKILKIAAPEAEVEQAHVRDDEQHEDRARRRSSSSAADRSGRRPCAARRPTPGRSSPGGPLLGRLRRRAWRVARPLPCDLRLGPRSGRCRNAGTGRRPRPPVTGSRSSACALVGARRRRITLGVGPGRSPSSVPVGSMALGRLRPELDGIGGRPRRRISGSTRSSAGVGSSCDPAGSLSATLRPFSHRSIDTASQGKRDLNPQPSVLETDALPVELLPFGAARRSPPPPRGRNGSCGRAKATASDTKSCSLVRFDGGVEPSPPRARARRLSPPARRAEPSRCSVAASSTQVASPSMAVATSSGEGKLGAIRMFRSRGSLPYGKAAPAPVIAIPASLASATTRVRRAVGARRG